MLHALCRPHSPAAVWHLRRTRPGDAVFFFFFNDTATTEIYTLSLHDALPIYLARACRSRLQPGARARRRRVGAAEQRDRKSTRLNSSHDQISYAVFCLKKKKKPADCNTPCATPTARDGGTTAVSRVSVADAPA